MARVEQSTQGWQRHIIDSAGEPGTSKTCGNCGTWKPNLTLGDKVYCCDRCGVRIHRDTANGARNNFFAALGKAMGVPADTTSARRKLNFRGTNCSHCGDRG